MIWLRHSEGQHATNLDLVTNLAVENTTWDGDLYQLRAVQHDDHAILATGTHDQMVALLTAVMNDAFVHADSGPFSVIDVDMLARWGAK